MHTDTLASAAANSDPYALKRKYGRQMTFWGGLGSQSTIPLGTPASIRAEVARLCREMGRGGGYILRGSKHLQPETPTENAARTCAVGNCGYGHGWIVRRTRPRRGR